MSVCDAGTRSFRFFALFQWHTHIVHTLADSDSGWHMRCSCLFAVCFPAACYTHACSCPCVRVVCCCHKHSHIHITHIVCVCSVFVCTEFKMRARTRVLICQNCMEFGEADRERESGHSFTQRSNVVHVVCAYIIHVCRVVSFVRLPVCLLACLTAFVRSLAHIVLCAYSNKNSFSQYSDEPSTKCANPNRQMGASETTRCAIPPTKMSAMCAMCRARWHSLRHRFGSRRSNRLLLCRSRLRQRFVYLINSDSYPFSICLLMAFE